MRTFTTILTVLLLLTVVALQAATTRMLEGTVEKVFDGDTVSLVTETNTIKVRLYGIDFPELTRRTRKGQPYGKEARQALEEKIAGKKVVVDVVDVDKHRLILGRIMLGDRDINREMIEGGWAWAYRQHLKEPYTTPYQTAEMYARKKRLGLWQQDNPDPPWSFRLDQKLH